MAKKAIAVDPADGLIIGEVGPWAVEKHDRLRKYIDASGGARANYLPPPEWRAGTSYIELYSGAGRSLIKDTEKIIDGSPLVAYKAAADSGAMFGVYHNIPQDANIKHVAMLRAARADNGPGDHILTMRPDRLNPACISNSTGLRTAFEAVLFTRLEVVPKERSSGAKEPI